MESKGQSRMGIRCPHCAAEVDESGRCIACRAFVGTTNWQVQVSGADAEEVGTVATELSDKMSTQHAQQNDGGERAMVKSTEYIETLGRIWRIVAFISCAVGIILAIGGIVVAIIGHQAETTMSFLGNEIETTSVGIGLAFLGAVVVAVVIRRILKSVDHATSSDTSPRG